MTRNVTVIIVSYNTENILPRCLDSIARQSYKGGVKTIVVDTGSDGTSTLVKKQYPWIDYIPHPQNDGFGRANNLGMKKHYQNSNYFLILNPDAELMPENLGKMISYMEENQNVAVVSCKLILPSGKLDRGCKRGFPTPWKSMCRFLFLDRLFPKTKLFGGYNLTFLDENQIHEVDSVKGAYMLVRKKAIDEVGMFDEDYWMYGEDLDWCYRFKQNGWKVVYNPDVSCIHYEGVSSGLKKSSQHITKASKQTRERTIRAFHESMHIFYNKHYKHNYPWVVNKLVMATVNIKMMLALLRLKFKS